MWICARVLLLCGLAIIDIKVMHRVLSTSDVILEHFQNDLACKKHFSEKCLTALSRTCKAFHNDPDSPRANMNDHKLNPS